MIQDVTDAFLKHSILYLENELPERHLSFLKKGTNAARQGWAWETISQISESKACDAYSYSFEHGTPALKKGPSGVLSLGRSLSLFYFDILTGGYLASFLYLMIPLWNRVSRTNGAETRPP